MGWVRIDARPPADTPLAPRSLCSDNQRQPPLLRRSLAAVAAASPPPRDAAGADEKAKSKKRAYDWRDPLLIRGQLTEEERMIQEMAQAYCQQSLMPR